MEAVSNERTAHEGGEESAAAVVYQHRLREHNSRVFSLLAGAAADADAESRVENLVQLYL